MKPDFTLSLNRVCYAMSLFKIDELNVNHYTNNKDMCYVTYYTWGWRFRIITLQNYGIVIENSFSPLLVNAILMKTGLNGVFYPRQGYLLEYEGLDGIRIAKKLYFKFVANDLNIPPVDRINVIDFADRKGFRVKFTGYDNVNREIIFNYTDQKPPLSINGKYYDIIIEENDYDKESVLKPFMHLGYKPYRNFSRIRLGQNLFFSFEETSDEKENKK